MMIILSIFLLTNALAFNYVLERYKKTWEDAEQYCVDIYNTHLATITDDDSARELKKLVGVDAVAWIGLNDIEVTGQWVYADGTLCPTVDGNCDSDYKYWVPGEPSYHPDHPDEHCAYVSGAYSVINHANKLIGDKSCERKWQGGFVCNSPGRESSDSLISFFGFTMTEQRACADYAQTDNKLFDITLAQCYEECINLAGCKSFLYEPRFSGCYPSTTCTLNQTEDYSNEPLLYFYEFTMDVFDDLDDFSMTEQRACVRMNDAMIVGETLLQCYYYCRMELVGCKSFEYFLGHRNKNYESLCQPSTECTLNQTVDQKNKWGPLWFYEYHQPGFTDMTMSPVYPHALQSPQDTVKDLRKNLNGDSFKPENYPHVAYYSSFGFNQNTALMASVLLNFVLISIIGCCFVFNLSTRNKLKNKMYGIVENDENEENDDSV